VRPIDPNLDRVQLIAAALKPLLDELVFVGGCAAGLLINDPGAAPIRATLDVDLVTSVTALADYHKLESRFSELGFKRDMTADAPICRWKYLGIEVDLMPTDPKVLGFANRWYPLALATAQRIALPNGLSIQLISGPAFVATKFEAFSDRGKGDLLASHDLEDILNVVASRIQLLEEIGRSRSELRRYLSERCRALLVYPEFENYLPGIIRDDATNEQSRLVLDRLRSITKFR
jgi:predicted nucleotidyltransferase